MAPRNAQAYAAAIKRRLDAIPRQVADSLKKAQNQNADEMVALAKSLVPVLKIETRKRRAGALRDSIHKEPGKTDLGVLVTAGSADAFYARFVEFGTRAGTGGAQADFTELLTIERGAERQNRRRKVYRTHPGTKAQPFFFPAYRALKKRMKGRAARAARAAIKAVAAGGSASS